MNVFKRFLSMLLVLCMLVSVVPMTTLAAETDSTEPTVAETTHETTVTTEETTEVIEETTVATEATEEATEATAEATEATEEATEATAEATEATEEATEATVEATEATEEAIDSVEKTVESDIALFAVNLGTKPEDGTVNGEPFNDDASLSDNSPEYTNHRIPGIVMLDNGTLVASADIRYDCEYDGGGSDIVVSRSTDKGETWHYSVVAYLGDNGNIHDPTSSTMMDPVIITDGTNLYLLYDLFPAGFSLGGGDNTTYRFDRNGGTGTGFDSQGRLLLGTTYPSTNCGYYLENGKIYATDGTEQEGYTVDAWFNVSYNGTYVSNLFFVESPFYAYPTSYACIQTSTDGGESWSDPEMLKTKHDGTAWQVLGPGSGIVTSSGELAFTVYNSDGSISLVHGTSGNWKTVKTSAATNESSVVELSDGTIRAFVKNGGNKVTYVDFTRNGDSYTAGSAKTTNVSNTGWCMVSSLKYSKLINGQEAIFVCCPSSGTDVRSNGKIHVFTLDDSNNMTLLKSYAVNGNVFFAYSDMAELNGGSDIALLYEDGCMYYTNQNNGVGYSHIEYTKLSVKNDILSGLNVEITEIPPHLTDSTGSKVSDTFVKNGTTATYTIKNLPADATASAVSGDDTVVTASVTGDTLTLTGVGNGTATVTVTAGTYTLQLAVRVAATANVESILVPAGTQKTITQNEIVADGSYSDAYADVTWSGATVTVKYPVAQLGTDSSFSGNEINLNDCLYTFTKNTDGTYIISGKTADGTTVYLNHLQNGAGFPNSVTQKAITVAAESSYFCFYAPDANNTNSYLYFYIDGNNRFDRYGNGGSMSQCQFQLYRPVKDGETASTSVPGYIKVSSTEDLDGGQYLIVASYNEPAYVLHPSTTTSGDANKFAHVAKITGSVTETSEEKTTITITGKAEGTTSVEIGNTTYDITVSSDTREITLHAGESVTDTIEGAAYTMDDASVEDNSIASIDVKATTVAGATETTVSTTKATALEDGATYIIRVYDTNYALSSDSGSGAWGTRTLAFQSNTLAADQKHLWTLEASGDGYKLKSAAGYLNLGTGNNAAYLDESGEVFTITSTTTGWTIGNQSGRYINALGGLTTYYSAGGWTGDGTRFDLYKVVIETESVPATEVTFTGLKVGKTTATVGHVKYNITVEYKVKDIVLYVGAGNKTVPVTGTVTADQITEFNAANASVVTVALSADGTEMILTGVGVGTVSDALLGNTKYNIQVREDIRDIHLYPGQTKTDLIKGIAYTDGTVVDDSKARLDSVQGVTAGATKSLVPVTSIESGKQYLIVANRPAGIGGAAADPTNSVLTGTPAGDQLNDLYMGGPVSTDSTDLWTITKVTGGYTVKQGEKFLTFGDGTAALTTTETVLTLNYYTNGGYRDGWALQLGNYYLSDLRGTESDNASGYGTFADDGNFWTIYEIVGEPSDDFTEVTFTGVAEGTTTATVGHVKYNITVSWTIPITIYEGTAKTDILVGYQYTNADVKSMPDGSVAFIHAVETNSDGDTVVYFSGVAAGETTAKVGKFTYEIKVIPLSGTEDDTGDIEDFRSIVGIGTYSDGGTSNLNMTGKEIKSLRISEGASFQLDVDVTGYDSIVWSSADESIATVENGLVTAVAEGETMVSATVTKNGVTETISVAVTVVPSLVEGLTANQICPIFYYIEEVHDTDPYYTLFLTSESVTEAVENHELVMVTEGEVIWIERPKSAGMAVVWTADPFDGTALTFMSATGSLGDYYPLQTENGELGTGVDGTTEYYVGADGSTGAHRGYNNIVNNTNLQADWDDAIKEMLNKAILVGKGLWEEVGCDGAMSMSRNNNDGVPKIVSSLSFVSDELPVLDKSINGILPATRLEKDFRTYTDGMTATVGEYVYFNLTITLERPHIWANNDEAAGVAALQYSNAILSDLALGDKAYFYTKDLDLQGDADGILDGTVEERYQVQELDDIVNDMNKAWETDEKVRVLEYYVIYEIQSEDIAKSEIINTADLNYNYKSAYSHGGKDAAADAEATITVVGSTMSNVVIDFGQIVKNENVSSEALKYVTTDTFETTYGKVTVSGNGDAQNDGSGTFYNSYTVIYEPTSILQGPDVIQLYGTYTVDGTEITKVINGFTVYPATSVYYEEGFIFDSNSTGWDLTQAAKATMEQKFEPLGKANYDDNGTLTSITSAKVHPYGYDDIYSDSSTGSGSSFAVSSANGAETSFTFTGTGFQLYANSNASSGYVTVYSKGELNKLYMINTQLSAGNTPATNQQSGGTYYSLPIISETALPYGTYTVRIKQTNGDDPIYIDGVRIINTLEDNDLFITDEEDYPDFHELRDYVLNAIGVEGLDKSAYIDPEEDADGQRDYDALVDEVSQMAGQVYTALGTGTKAALITDYAIFGDLDTSDEMTEGEKAAYQQKIQDLLDNGPKNELYLYPGQTLVFSVTTPRVVQLGLKSPTGSAEFTLTAGAAKVDIDGNAGDVETLNSTVDMFYEIAAKGEATDGKVFTIKNTGDSGVLSVTLLKICDDPNFNFNDLTKEDIEAALLSVYGLLNEDVPEEDETPSEPTEPDPTEPEPTEPDATEPDPTEPEAPKTEGVTRLAGADRLVTSYLVADQLKAKMGVEKFQNIIVASGATFADALPGSYLSAVKNAPILLTLAKDKYVNQTADYIKANLAEGGTVYILGGESAVPAAMEKALEGINVKRVAGEDRFGTNLAILKEAGVKAGDEILVCTAKEFADSLSAAATGKPILLVYKKITDEQKAYLQTLSGNTFCVVGGTTAVPENLEEAMKAYGEVSRLAGKDRLDTSILVAKKYFPDATTSVVAYGWDFPDGLCGGSLAYATKSPLILAHSKEKLAQFTADYTVKAGLKAGYVLGGEGLVDDAATRAIFSMGSENITILK